MDNWRQDQKWEQNETLTTNFRSEWNGEPNLKMYTLDTKTNIYPKQKPDVCAWEVCIVVYLIISQRHGNSTSHQSSPPNHNLYSLILFFLLFLGATEQKIKNHEQFTWCLILSLSPSDFFEKLNKKESGKTKHALPIITRPSRTALAPTDFPGLKKFQNHVKHINYQKYIWSNIIA